MPWAPTTDQLLDLEGVRRRADRFRFDLLDNTDTLIGEIHPLTSGLTLTNDTGAQVPRTLTGLRLPASEAQAINVITDRVRPVMVLQNGAEFNLGVLMWADDNRPVRAWGTEHASTLGDKMNILNQGIPTTIGFPKGADIGIAALGVARQVLGTDEIVIDTITADFAVGQTWAIGATRREILSKMMELVGFLPPHFDRDGRLRLVDAPDMDTVTPGLVYEAGGRIVADSILDSDDLLSAPNRWIVYETSGQAQVVGVYVVPASAPHSFENRGYYVTHSESAQGLGTVDRANKAAKTLALTEGQPFKWRTFQSTMDPRHDAWDPVTCLGEAWMETRWSAQLHSGGLMQHVLKAVF